MTLRRVAIILWTWALAVTSARADTVPPKTSAAKPAPALAAPDATVDLNDEDEKAAAAWVKARVANAKAKKRELVRVPWVHHGPGWGCDCPEEYVGTDDNANVFNLWLKTDFAPKVEEQDPRSPSEKENGAGFMMVAEGWFTGEKEKRAYEDGQVKYDLLGFHVERWRKHRGEADNKLTVVLAGAALDEKVAELADDRPWLVVVDSLSRFDKGTDVRAEALRKKVAAAGLSGAEVIDSRQARLLFCCYRVVVAGRYPTREAALAAAADLRKKSKKKLDATVRLGW